MCRRCLGELNVIDSCCQFVGTYCPKVTEHRWNWNCTFSLPAHSFYCSLLEWSNCIQSKECTGILLSSIVFPNISIVLLFPALLFNSFQVPAIAVRLLMCLQRDGMFSNDHWRIDKDTCAPALHSIAQQVNGKSTNEDDWCSHFPSHNTHGV